MRAIAILIIYIFTIPSFATTEETETIQKKLDLVFHGPEKQRTAALNWIQQRNKQDVVAPLIYALRYIRHHNNQISNTLTSLTGVNHKDNWFDWMLWQQAHPEVMPFEGFDAFQSSLFTRIDPNFIQFLHPGVAHEIRLEEITWGGVRKDGIPALTNPKLISSEQATYLNDEDAVFGIEINGDVRAYPYRIMDWHEMFNDVIGGVPVSLAYCTLCGSGILYETTVNGHDKPFVFGSSGFLYRSNKLMYDQETHSLWNQFTGRPVVGTLTGSDIQLNVLPIVTTTWKQWKQQHPDTKVLSLDTGFQRDYTPGKPYGRYFSAPDLMFPALTDDKRLNSKDQVFGLRITGAEKAWPLKQFAGGKVINDRVGIIPIVVIGDLDTRTVRVYRAGDYQFKKSGNDLTTVRSLNDKTWRVTEDALIGPDGENLGRLPGHLAYWFAWSGYLKQADFYSE